MLKPSFRFFIIPLGAVCTLASLLFNKLETREASGGPAEPAIGAGFSGRTMAPRSR